MNNKSLEDSILNYLRLTKTARKLCNISRNLKIPSNTEEYDLMKAALEDLCAKGLVQRSKRHRYSISEEQHSGIIDGIIRINKGRGTLETKSKVFRKIVIKRRNLLTALDGDEVRVKILGLKKKPNRMVK